MMDAGLQRFRTTPTISRVSMVPQRWRREDESARLVRSRRTRWHHVAYRRRLLLLALALAQVWLATALMSQVLPYHGQQPLEAAILVLFAILFGWVSMGFWTAMAGLFVLLRKRDRYAVSRAAESDAPLDPSGRTAVVMPIANENVARVFAGLRATYESLAQTGELAHFDFYVLSDTSDPDLRVAEATAWEALCRAVDGFGCIYYRLRQHRIKRKSGNIADFCRRWGSRYRYMVILDADSVMSGACLVSLVRIANAHPDAGIIQTAPRATGRDTLFGRMQQFATRLYGPLFTAGLQYWQLGESHYWGHNAIIRIQPFTRYCALARLPGSGALSGEIMSHDFVEAALMRRAGWAVWIAYDLPGSYEEMPPNLCDELKRDRRWCLGNLMNARLMFAPGLHAAHRVVFMTGVMAYLSAPLWFLFLTLSTVQLALSSLVEPQYFVQPYQLFPRWPEWRPEWAISLATGTAFLLLVPKILSSLAVTRRNVARYGGDLRLLASIFAEIVASGLLAPIRMLFHTRFVLTALLGRSLPWKSPAREDAETSWGEALRRHGLQTAFGIAWTVVVYWLNPAYVWWISPVAGALIVSIPLSVYTSRASIGQRWRRAGLFMIPEETDPPPEILATRRYAAEAATQSTWIDAVLDPIRNEMMAALTPVRAAQPQWIRERRCRLVERALAIGPNALTAQERNVILADRAALKLLHLHALTLPSIHAEWIAERSGRMPENNGFSAAAPHSRQAMT